jgi:hypothetical protein
MTSDKYAERALKLLSSLLPDLRMGSKLLFVPPVEHVLRCFVLETGFAIKGTAYFWRLVMPLYRPPGFLVVNYGERLFAGERVSLLDADLDRTIDRLARAVSGGELERLRAIQSPQDFLRQIDWDSCPSTPNYRIDLALSHYMTGNVTACQEILDQVAAAPLNPRWADKIKLAQELAQDLRVNPVTLTQKIEAWKQDAIRWLHLAPPAKRRARVAVK